MTTQAQPASGNGHAERQSVPDSDILEQVVVYGDLSRLTAEQRVSYYKSVCESLGLNPLTKPFDYITLNNKLTLYARRDATDQLRKIHGVSIVKLTKEIVDGLVLFTAEASDKEKRTDVATGAVSVGSLKGEALANAIMKAETKAKRRVTLSICGLGVLDETEIDYVENDPLLAAAAHAAIEVRPNLSSANPPPIAHPEPEPEIEPQPMLASTVTVQTSSVAVVPPQSNHEGAVVSEGAATAPEVTEKPKGVTPEDVQKRFGGELKTGEAKLIRPFDANGAEGFKWYLRNVLDPEGVKEAGKKLQAFVLKAAGVKAIKDVTETKKGVLLELLDKKLSKDGRAGVAMLIQEKAK